MTEAAKATYHTSAYEAAGAAMMSFQPINQIHQQLCAFHIYAHDPSRAVKAHHYCTHLRPDLHQCVIYDSDKPNARLIGIEYVIPESTFLKLDAAERKYWHSHKYEVESGMLMLGTKSLIPNAVTDVAEIPAMTELHDTYGKTIHTWQYDTHPDLPLGPPQLMMAYTDDSQVQKDLLEERDKEMGVSTSAKREVRAKYLSKEQLEKPVAEGANYWLTGKSIQLEVKKVGVERRGKDASEP